MIRGMQDYKQMPHTASSRAQKVSDTPIKFVHKEEEAE